MRSAPHKPPLFFVSNQLDPNMLGVPIKNPDAAPFFYSSVLMFKISKSEKPKNLPQYQVLMSDFYEM